MKTAVKVGMYDNLNGDYPMKYMHLFNLEIDDVAYAAIKSNYGVHRLLSALVRQSQATGDRTPIIDKIEQLLNEGLY